MVLKRFFFPLCGVLLLSGCLNFSGFTMSGKSSLTNDVKITSISVDKSARRMYLLSDNTIIRSYRIGLGFTPNGHKSLRGDGKTPEGLYYIDRKNPNSKFYMSLGISYPNAQDRTYAQSIGASAGGDIFIHGQNKRSRNSRNLRFGAHRHPNLNHSVMGACGAGLAPKTIAHQIFPSAS